MLRIRIFLAKVGRLLMLTQDGAKIEKVEAVGGGVYHHRQYDLDDQALADQILANELGQAIEAGYKVSGHKIEDE